jgi:hypothetical protein
MANPKAKPLLQLKVEGPGVRSGGIDVPELLKICEHVQSTVNRKAEALEGQRSLRPGPITSAVRKECTLRLIALKKGSVTLSFAQAKPQLPLPGAGTFGQEVVEGVATDLKALFRKPKGLLDEGFDPGVLDSLKNLGDVLQGKSITRMEWVVPKGNGRKTAVKAIYNKTVHERVIERIIVPRRETTAIEGILEMADFRESDKRCRIHPPVGSPVLCSFDAEKEEEVYAVLRKPVKVQGEAILDPHTKRIELIHIKKIIPLEPLSLGASAFFSGKSIEELAALQGVKPLQNVGVLAGGLPADENLDELIEEIYRDRE